MNTAKPGDEGPFPGLTDAPVDAIVLRMLLGTQLRRFREAAGISPEQAGSEIRGSRSKISRMETGRVKLKPRDVADLLTMYGVTDEDIRHRFAALTRQSSEPDWWAKYSDVLPDWFEPYLGLESAAATIRGFDIQFVHSLFQIEPYARAVTNLAHQDAAPSEVNDRVALRLKRHDLLTRLAPPKIWSIIDESVLHRPVGGRAVLRAQLHHLLEVSQLPNVTLQVMPFTRSGHAGECGSFSLMRFNEPDLPDVVYIEQLTSAIYLEQRPDVEHYLKVMDRLGGHALTPIDTTALMQRTLHDI